jgi:transposase-like protein
MASRRVASDSGFPDFRNREPEPYPAQGVRDQAPAKVVPARPRSCSHCPSDQIVRWGAAHGLPRYRCLSCRRTFNILTNTPLARLRNKERWLTYVGTMFEGKSIRKSAAACAVSATTSSRWRQRFVNCTAEQRAKILGAIIGAYSNTPALTGISEDASAANMSWCKDLLPVILSWFL